MMQSVLGWYPRKWLDPSGPGADLWWRIGRVLQERWSSHYTACRLLAPCFSSIHTLRVLILCEVWRPVSLYE
eukprot:2048812-Pyramimonas_sp.AAC.1